LRHGGGGGRAAQRGTIVKDHLSCRNNSDVYSIGERAQHRGQIYGVVARLWDQAGIFAQRLTEENPDAPLQGAKVSTQLRVMGDKEPRSEEAELEHYSEPSRGVYKKLIIREGRLAGAILLGDGMAIPGVLRSFDRGQLLPQNRAELLFPTSAAAKVMDPANLPATALVCACNGVSKGRIGEAVQNVRDTFKAVCEATRAGSRLRDLQGSGAGGPGRRPQRPGGQQFPRARSVPP
jgi:nitrite reductase (NADH) large subunit